MVAASGGCVQHHVARRPSRHRSLSVRLRPRYRSRPSYQMFTRSSGSTHIASPGTQPKAAWNSDMFLRGEWNPPSGRRD